MPLLIKKENTVPICNDWYGVFMHRGKSTLDYRTEIKETECKLLDLERKQTHHLLRDRMRFLRQLKKGECASQGRVERVMGTGLTRIRKALEESDTLS